VVEYYPVISGPMIYVRDVPPAYRWWRRECPVYHPYVLVSYGQVYPNLSRDKEYLANYVKYMELTDEVKLILDSGGFQVVSRGLELDPLEVIQWQLSNARPNDIVVPLDLPPPPDTTSLELVESLAQKTARNTELLLKAVDRHGGNLRVVVPIQGLWKEAIDVWVKYMKDYVQVTGMVAFGGLAFKSSSKLTYVARFLMRLKPLLDLNVKYLHAFGAGSPFKLAFLLLISKYTGIAVSTDTSDSSKPIAYGRPLYPAEPLKLVMLRFFKRGDINVTKLICHCPACRAFGDGYIIRATKYTRYKHYAVTLHNLFQTLLHYDKLMWYASFDKVEDYLVRKYSVGSTVVNLIKDYLSMGEVRGVQVEEQVKPPPKRGLSRWL
jgi:tRNA-guanine family transglycosylase